MNEPIWIEFLSKCADGLKAGKHMRQPFRENGANLVGLELNSI